MNIFKILNSGDGRLKEPNLSAFLAYLLNPKADHGLGSDFLGKVLQVFIDEHAKGSKEEKFLQPLWSTEETNDEEEDKPYILDMSINSRFNVDVVLEKALRKIEENQEEKEEESRKKGKTKEIVDIIIKITEHKKTGKEDVGNLFEKEEPVVLILLENKIKKGKKIREQLSQQYEASIKDLPNRMPEDEWFKWKKNICTILISTGEKEICEQFQSFKNPKSDDHLEKHNANSIHLSWNDVDVDDSYEQPSGSIKRILIDLLKENMDGTIPPINTYALDTMKALINFIEDDFRSDADDQQHGGKKGKVIKFPSIDALENAIPTLFTSGMWELVKQTNQQILKVMEGEAGIEEPRHTEGHVIACFSKGKKFASISKKSKKAVRITYAYRTFYDKKDSPENFELLRRFLEKDKIMIQPKMDHWGYFLEFEENSDPQILANVVKVYYELYKHILSLKENNNP